MKYYKNTRYNEIFKVVNNDTWSFYQRDEKTWKARGKKGIRFQPENDTWDLFVNLYGSNLIPITEKEAFIEIL